MKITPVYKTAKFWKWFGIIFVGMALLGAILPDTPQQTDPAEVKTKAETNKTIELSDDDRANAESAIEDVKKAEAQKVDVVKTLAPAPVAVKSDKNAIIAAVKSAYGAGEYINVEYVEGINVAMVQVRREVGWSASNLGKATLIDTVDLLKFAQGLNGLVAIDIRVLSPLKDQYGNTTDGRVMDMRFERATLDKINFDGVDWRNLPQIADDFWAHNDISL